MLVPRPTYNFHAISNEIVIRSEIQWVTGLVD
jgi:hypothetical protein